MTLQTRNIPTEMWKYLSSCIRPQTDEKASYLNEDSMKGAKDVINLSNTCRDLYIILEEERVTAVKDLKNNRLNNCIKKRFQQSQDDLSINSPEKLIEAFRSFKNNIASLPVLDLKGRGHAGYIDFIEPQDMSHSIMQFKDKLNRRGIAMHLRVHEAGSEYLNSEDVLVCFQRDGANNSNWATYLPSILNSAYNKYHDKFEHTGPYLTACNICKISTHPLFLNKIVPRILAGTDPLFKLADSSNKKTSWISFFKNKIFSVIVSG